jgi:hypothetical protein
LAAQEELAAEGEQNHDDDATDQELATVEGKLAHAANRDNDTVTSV